MSHILLITSSPRLASCSTKVAHALAEQLAAREPNSTLTVRDRRFDRFEAHPSNLERVGRMIEDEPGTESRDGGHGRQAT